MRTIPILNLNIVAVTSANVLPESTVEDQTAAKRKPWSCQGEAVLGRKVSTSERNEPLAAKWTQIDFELIELNE